MAIEVSARMGKAEDARSVKVSYNLPEKLDQLTKRFTEEVCVAHIRSSFVIALQSYMRSLMKQNKSDAEIQEAVNAWKPGMRTPGKSATEKATDALKKLSSEERKSVLAALTDAA